MAAPTSGVCGPWISPEDVTACCSGLSNPVNAPQLAKAITFATSILFRLSGRQYPGICTRTVRPCGGEGTGCGSMSWAQWPAEGWSFAVWDQAAGGFSFPAVPYRSDGEWYNAWAGCGGLCSLPSLRLPAPVATVTEIVIEGVVLDPAAYKIEGFNDVVRVDGGSWPCMQDRRRESAAYVGANDGSRAGTWQITYEFGRGPGEDGEIVTAQYACEIAKFLCNAADCNLPQRVKSVQREGVSLDFLDPMTFIEDNKTGIALVDMWLHSVNPTKNSRRATVRRLEGRSQPRGFSG